MLYSNHCYIGVIYPFFKYHIYKISWLSRELCQFLIVKIGFWQDKQRVVFQPYAAAAHLHLCPKFLDFTRFCPLSRVRKYELTKPIISDHLRLFLLCRIHIMTLSSKDLFTLQSLNSNIHNPPKPFIYQPFSSFTHIFTLLHPHIQR